MIGCLFNVDVCVRITDSHGVLVVYAWHDIDIILSLVWYLLFYVWCWFWSHSRLRALNCSVMCWFALLYVINKGAVLCWKWIYFSSWILCSIARRQMYMFELDQMCRMQLCWGHWSVVKLGGYVPDQHREQRPLKMHRPFCFSLLSDTSALIWWLSTTCHLHVARELYTPRIISNSNYLRYFLISFWWWFDWNFARLRRVPTLTTATSIIFCCSIIQNGWTFWLSWKLAVNLNVVVVTGI